MTPKITDKQRGGRTVAIRSVCPPGAHSGYAVIGVTEKAILSVCKYYGRATEVADQSGAIVVPAILCEKFQYKRRRKKRAKQVA